MAAPPATSTFPYCCACGWDVSRVTLDSNEDDAYECDACGTDLKRCGMVQASIATAGIPGTWNGDILPYDLADLQASSITASPATAWTTGQYVTLRDGTQAYWNGSAWAAGAAP